MARVSGALGKGVHIEAGTAEMTESVPRKVHMF